VFIYTVVLENIFSGLSCCTQHAESPYLWNVHTWGVKSHPICGWVSTMQKVLGFKICVFNSEQQRSCRQPTIHNGRSSTATKITCQMHRSRPFMLLVRRGMGARWFVSHEYYSRGTETRQIELNIIFIHTSSPIRMQLSWYLAMSVFVSTCL
jgi:hypothetical protein